MNNYNGNTVYIVTNRIGENINDDDIMRAIIGVYAVKEDAIRRKEKEERETDFNDCNRFYVEPWLVRKAV